MRTIRKGVEPASLTQHRAAGMGYGDYRDTEALRDSLVKEQRGLCCYCLSRIPAKNGKMKIEHWHSQAQYPDEQLDYRNLLGACSGGEGQPGKNQHCDTRKGDQGLTYNPANPTHRIEERLRYLGNGMIESADPDFDTEIDTVLNLNLAFLRNNRKNVLTAFQGTLGKRMLSHTGIQRALKRWSGESGDGELEPYCQVVVYWLRKRLARA